MKNRTPTLSHLVKNFPVKLAAGERIIWNARYTSEIPAVVRHDPLIGLLTKYYNSAYFRGRNGSDAAIKRAKRSFDFLLNSVVIPLGGSPDNVLFEFVKAVRNAISNSEGVVYALFTNLTTPIYALGRGGRGGGKGRELRAQLLNEIPFSNRELEFVQRLCLKENIPRVRLPETNGKKDLLTHLNYDGDGQALVMSLRKFSAWYIIEWSTIRKRMREICKHEIDLLVEYIKNDPTRQNEILHRQYLDDKIKDIVFQIVKAVNHPLLTERFAMAYFTLRTNSSKRRNDFISKQTIYDFENFVSGANKINFIEIIDDNYSFKATDLTNKEHHCGGNLISVCPAIMNPDWMGPVSGVMSITDLLGLTSEEEICFAWLLASDRHQPSSIARMTPEDIEETENTLSTILNPLSVKFRSSRVSGMAYKSGELYRKNGNIFEAIKAYKRQLQYCYETGFFAAKAASRPILPRITTLTPAPLLNAYYFRFHKSVKPSLQLLLCAMNGTMSSGIASKDPAHDQWLAAVILAAKSSRKSKRSKGHKILACDFIQRQVVNNSLKRSVDIGSVPTSNNCDLATVSEDIEGKNRLQAAVQNHSLEVRSRIYLDKAPRTVLLAQTTRFGARVGDEMIRIGMNLAKHFASQIQVLTIPEARSLLGLETRSEMFSCEVFDANYLLEQAKIQNYIVDEIGEAKCGGSRFILRTPLTVALILSKIEHIDNHIGSLLANNDVRANQLVAHRFYLQLLIDEMFTKKEIEEARRLYGAYTFPMNDILA